MNSLISAIIQLAVLLLVAPLVSGVIKKIKALSQKRIGPPVLQLYFDLLKLFRKDTVVSETASWVFRAAPYVTLIAVLAASLLIPVSTRLQPFNFLGDVILAIYLLALGRFFMTLAGLDPGSTFGGMGSSRESMVAALVEPTMLAGLFTIGLAAKSASVYEMMVFSSKLGWGIFQPVYLLTFSALFIILIAETSRIPVDDPATHLELTMVHEAMLLEYSGRYLALMELGAALKQLLLITILANLFIPVEGWINLSNPALALGLSLLIYLGKVIFIAVLVAVTEIHTVKLRLFTVPNLAAIAFILSFLGFFQYLVLRG
ncbi:MAG: NADH-quinone oxidoreductase subunit H [Firmicutes bacterium]|nr:NADH-quinone oxidoreductase subunit H [Bacillota bacterium]